MKVTMNIRNRKVRKEMVERAREKDWKEYGSQIQEIYNENKKITLYDTDNTARSRGASLHVCR